MSQIDRLLEALRDAKGDALRLQPDEAVRLERNGAEQALTRQPLAREHIDRLVRDVAPAHAIPDLDAGRDLTFEFTRASGSYVAVMSDAGATLRIRPAAAPNGSSAHGSSTGVASPPAAAAPNDGAHRAALDALLATMLQRRASDLHLRTGVAPLLRIDGRMEALDGEAPLTSEGIRAMLEAVMPPNRREEFQRTNDCDFAHELPGQARFRGNAFMDRHGVGAVFRAIPNKLVSAEDLGLSDDVKALCQLSKGLVLVTGPTGSGKSTTLCALIDLVNRSRHDHIITIEDPIEFVHDRKGCLITQREVGTHTGSFKHALRAALREDPDVVLVGELRDLETMAIAIETAETGHLVFGTLHTSTAPSTIDRIIDQFPADRQAQVRVMLSESLKGVISQVLCRKIGGGRAAAMEILLSTPALSNLIRESKTFQIPSVMQTSRKLGMMTMTDALLDLVDKRLIEPAEAYLRATEKNAVLQGLTSRGHDTSFADPSASAPPPAPGGTRPTPMGRVPTAVKR